jgi:Rrf2 family iron-sulfur cluster assembly transcriptional regulator
MWLPQTAEYALRAMALLARAPAGAVLVGPDLAERARIPSPYLSKVMRRLVVAGLVVARRGRGGGFSLARAPGTIRLSEVLEAMDVQVSARKCVFGWSACRDDRPCPLHPLWVELSARQRRWAEETTLDCVEGIDEPPGS